MSNKEIYIEKERDMPSWLGLSRDYLRQLRQKNLVQGLDWELVHREVVLTWPAVEKVGALLGVTVQKTRLENLAPEVKMIVVRADWPMNKHILTAQLWPAKKKDCVFRVKVKNNTKFRKGMEIRARRINESLFELVGPCPRWPGKW